MLFCPTNTGRKGEGGLRTKGYFKISDADKPLVSVITVVFNGERYLEDAIMSVIEQTYDNVEYVIIDGGSTDKTLDIIRRYENLIDYWVSEPDNGISDAFNKGIKLQTGDLVGILNADDWYEKDCIETVVGKLGDGDVFHGQIRHWEGDKIYNVYYPNHLRLPLAMTINHPTVFVKKQVYNCHGLFRLDYRCAMDYELLLRFYTNNVKFIYIEKVLANMRGGGYSAMFGLEGFKEIKKAKIDHLRNPFSAYVYFLAQVIKYKLSFFLIKIGFTFLVNFYRKYFSVVKQY